MIRTACDSERLNMVRLCAFLIVCCVSLSVVQAQDTTRRAGSDSTMRRNLGVAVAPPLELSSLRSSWGVDLLVSINGFGLGTFYRHEYSDDLSGFIDFSISEAKDDNEVEFYDIYGRPFTPDKVNRFLVLPLFVGAEKRMFADDITDNFRPFIEAAAGPSMIYVFPYNDEYFTALGKGSLRYTAGGYVGIGAYFGSERTNFLGMNIRYYYIPYPGGILSMQHVTSAGTSNVMKNQFGGLVISLSFGTSW
jgi:hypothetical protein